MFNYISSEYKKWNLPVYDTNFSIFTSNDMDIKNGIYVIELNEIKLEVLIKDLEKSILRDRHCLVVFGGALSKRGIPPFFSGLQLADELNIPLISISDPSLALSDDLMLAWYAGNYLEKQLPEKIAKILDSIFEKNRLKPIIIGGSGGGFASLVQMKLLKTKVTTIVWNPQTIIYEFNLNMVFNYLKSCFPNILKNIEETLFLPKIEHKNGAMKLLKELNIISDISNLQNSNNSTLIYLQNITDIYHVNNQMTPFFKKHKEWSKMNSSTFKNDNFYLHIGNWGEGHVAPSKKYLVPIIDNIINKLSVSDILNCLSDSYINNINIPMLPLNFNQNNINFNFVNNKIEIVVNSPDSENLEYAIYFLKNNEKVQVVWYQKSNKFDLPDQEFNTIHLFVKDFFDNKIQKKINVTLYNDSLKELTYTYDKSESIGFNILKNNIWHTPKFGDIVFGPLHEVNWNQDPFKNRTWVWLFQQLNFIKDLFEYDKINSCTDGLEYSNLVIKSWFNTCKTTDYNSIIFWHDHGSALRLRRVMDVKAGLIKNNLWNDIERDFYQNLITLHVNYLLDEKYYSKGTNHGLDQTITLFLAIVTNLDQEWANNSIDVCKSRLIFEISKMFGDDGGHFENSCHYQGLGINQLFMIKNLLNKYNIILSAESVVPQKFIDKTTEVLAYMLSPLGKFVLFGDTEETAPSNIFTKYNKSAAYPIFEYALTAGKQGIRPKQNILVLPKSGWAFYRALWESELDFYIAAKCGFNSNYHRQDDDTSFILFYQGQEWFIDSGLYNYHESDHNRKHIRSHFGHNMSFPQKINPVRKLEHYLGESKIHLDETLPNIFSINMSSQIFSDFCINRSIRADLDNNFEIHDTILSKNEYNLYTTRFIIPSDKRIDINEKYIDIVGTGYTLRMSFNNPCHDIQVTIINISKKLNILSEAQALDLNFSIEKFDMIYNFKWIKTDN